VHQYHGIALALLTYEAAHPAGLEIPTGSPVLLDRLRDGLSHEWIIALCVFAGDRGLGSLLRWPRKPL
jgi:hypothetical protein